MDNEHNGLNEQNELNDKMKTVKFYTLGCKVNQYDTQSIREHLLQAGLKELECSSPADLYVVNTCTVTQRADSDSLNLIRRAKRENPQARIIVTGCLTELDQDKIINAHSASLIVRNKDKYRIPELLNAFGEPVEIKEDNELNEHNEHNELNQTRITYFKAHTRAFLKIQDGCDNFCSYCKVPLVRGESGSRQLSEIFQEAENLARNGFREIVLCGICLGSYGRDLRPQRGIVDVIEALEEIQGIYRIRLSSIEAADMSEELIEKMSRAKKLCPHLHIPIQSGDNEILRKMNRRYSRDDYLSLVKRIRDRIPLATITTDVLVGFPTEDQRSFQNTIDLVKKVMPLKVHIFGYSKREGTSASNNFKCAINPIIIKERINRLKSVAQASAAFCKKKFLAKDMEVLIEGQCKKDFKFWQGYTSNYIKVIFEAKENLKNQLIRVKLKEIVQDKMLGVLA